ncbi:MAG: glycosyltransferase [Maribacter sp.]|nr:glycosyltransferase [Maribacter sp.]
MISIIIPAHNERENLSFLLKDISLSANKQSYEVIVALSPTNGDNSEKLQESNHAQIIQCKKLCRAVQMNEAARLAKGNVLAFLHADVKPPRSFLNDIEKTIEEGYDAGFFSYKFDKKSFFLRINASFTSKDGIFTGGGDQCLFIKRSIFEKLNGFDDRQVLMEDFEFFDRMKRNRIRYKIIKNNLIVSARKYQNNSYVRVNFTNLLLVVLFKMGYSAEKLKSLHNRLIRGQNHS